jgi:hypothetical protein
MVLTFREIFSSTRHFSALRIVTLLFFDFTILVNGGDSRVATVDGGSTKGNCCIRDTTGRK